MNREKHYFDGEKLRHTCVYCYLKWVTEYKKKKMGDDNENSDDIL
jgi:hypothetical protein